MKLFSEYDAAADIFFISTDAFQCVTGGVDDAGVIFRYEVASGSPCGAAVINFLSWEEDLPDLATRIGTHLSLPPSEILPLLAKDQENG